MAKLIPMPTISVESITTKAMTYVDPRLVNGTNKVYTSFLALK